MAEVPEGSFTHTLEQIDAATTQVEDAKGNAASLAAAITAAAETAATTAVGALDVSSVGGSGKYISAISEADGKISATAKNLASAPASGGTEAISSGAVYTALSGKIGISDVFGIGTEIPSPANLNDDTYKSIGVYYRSSTSNSGISNIPIDGYAFKLIVEYVNSSSRIRQIFIPLNSSAIFYIRLFTGSGWQAWHTFKSEDGMLGAGTTITATSAAPLDVHSITTCGRYNFTTASAGNMTNMPYRNSGGELIVEQIQGSTRIRQTLIFNNYDTMVGIFYVSFLYDGNPDSNPSWSSWYKFEGTAVTT